MSVLLTLHKRTQHPADTLRAALDVLARNPKADVYRLLFETDSS
jgi:hypothetical protein